MKTTIEVRIPGYKGADTAIGTVLRVVGPRGHVRIFGVRYRVQDPDGCAHVRVPKSEVPRDLDSQGYR